MNGAEHVTRIGQMMNAYNILVCNPEGKEPLGRTRLRWKGNIKAYLQEECGSTPPHVFMA
jgi:hypothetical protein